MNQGLRVKDIADFIEKDSPLYIAEEWDNVGLMVGDYNSLVGGVLFCMDITEEIIEEAIEYNCQMIVTHHPFIFHPLKHIREDSYKGSLIMKIIRNSISVYSAHTNLDYAHDGVNHCLADALELNNVEIIKPHPKGFADEANEMYGLGRVGELPEVMDINYFCMYVKEKLNTSAVRLTGKRDARNVRRIGVSSGAFDHDDMDAVLSRKVDVLVTGDLKYNPIMEQRGTGIYFIDAGHFSTERVVLKSLKDKFAREFKDILFFVSKEEREPFIYI
jgi:dinuclear metal center YbgI/SA1388 family protein